MMVFLLEIKRPQGAPPGMKSPIMRVWEHTPTSKPGEMLQQRIFSRFRLCTYKGIACKRSNVRKNGVQLTTTAPHFVYELSDYVAFGIFTIFCGLLLPLPLRKLTLPILALVKRQNIREDTMCHRLDGILRNVGIVDELFFLPMIAS
ncbi:MAG: hypothetical protein LUH36_02290 [Oscillospiraceae bacterium]|nr:hypothetical protein [Oscillospiraceae bacterium]